MITVLVPLGRLLEGVEIELETEEAHHLRVRRAAPGTPLRLLDGAGGVGEGDLLADSLRVAVRHVRQVEPPDPFRLVVGAGDRDRFSTLVEKCAELGVTELIPVETERTRSVSSRVQPSHLGRMRRRALEAIKQSGNVWAPVIADLAGLEDAVARTAGGCGWLADAAGDPAAALPGPPSVVAIGPEGGFSAEERALLVRKGFHPARLGPHILRFETAAIAAAVLARGAARRQVHE